MLDYIDKLSGAELNRLAYELGLAPEGSYPSPAGHMWVWLPDDGCFEPAQDTDQALAMAKRHHSRIMTNYWDEWESPHHAAVDGTLNIRNKTASCGSTMAIALTRACCKAAVLRKETE